MGAGGEGRGGEEEGGGGVVSTRVLALETLIFRSIMDL